jgi:hypothetical protein
MKGIYITVPDNEFDFYMSVLERFKTATIVQTDTMVLQDETLQLQNWQIEELNEAIAYDNANPTEGIEAKTFINQLRKNLNV